MTDELEIRWASYPGGRRLAWTSGLNLVNHLELTVPVDWPPDGARDQLVERILQFIAQYVRESGRTLKPGETMSSGWSTLRVADSLSGASFAPSDALTITETLDPFGDQSHGFTPGVRRTVDILLAQEAVLARYGLSGQGEFPHASQLAVVCGRLIRGATDRRTLQAKRWPSEAEETDSRWQIGCIDEDHDHDDSGNWTVSHLRHVAEAFPFVIQYLALPADSAFTVTEGKVSVFRPGEEECQIDPGDPLSWQP
jgi:hypothetical protein